MQTESGRVPSLAYVHGANAVEQARLVRRTALTSAAFLLPYLRPGWRLLDCGCGVGSITCDLAEMVAPGGAVGIDSQPAQIEFARCLAVERGVANVQFDVGSVHELPYPHASFDAVFANTLIQHLADPRWALTEMRRVLKPGGVVGIADDDLSALIWEPRTPALTQALRLICGVIEQYGGDLGRARHHRRLLRETGFTRTIATGALGGGGVWGSPEDTRMFAAWCADQLRAPATAELMLREGWADKPTLEAIISDVLDWGEQPDALFGIFGIATLGWA